MRSSTAAAQTGLGFGRHAVSPNLVLSPEANGFPAAVGGNNAPLMKVVRADFEGAVVERGEAHGFHVNDVVLVLQRAFDQQEA